MVFGLNTEPCGSATINLPEENFLSVLQKLEESLEEKLFQLQELFPLLQQDFLLYTLLESDGQVERAVEVLLGFPAEAEASSNPTTALVEAVAPTTSKQTTPLVFSQWSRKPSRLFNPPQTKATPRPPEASPPPPPPSLSHNPAPSTCFPSPQPSSSVHLKEMASEENSTSFIPVVNKRNRRPTGQQCGGGCSGVQLTLDLHGFQVTDSQNLLRKLLLGGVGEGVGLSKQSVLKAGKSYRLTIITGRGKHSPGRVAKLRPAVTSFLRKNIQDHLWEEVHDGVFVVHFHTPSASNF